ncbi:MAG: adenylate/guanylate cyclase domain-containing protein [Phycisphaerales bacterium]|nr:adenylate/guanylate cyclase domain-containing protein [Phycisphaerales bacterium]
MTSRSNHKPPSTMRGIRHALAIGAVAVVAILAMQGLGWFAAPEAGLAAWRFRHADALAPKPASDQITMVAIDDAALATWGEWGDWSRDRLASVIDLFTLLGARTIVLDVRFETPRDAKEDQTLADAMRRHGNVAIAVGETPPIEPIRSAARAMGSVAFDESPGGLILEVPTRAGFEDAIQLGLVGAALYKNNQPVASHDAMLVPWTDKVGVRTARGANHAWRKSLPIISIAAPLRLGAELDEFQQTLSAMLEREVRWPIDDATLADAASEADFLRNAFGREPINTALQRLQALANPTDEQRRALAAATLVSKYDRLAPTWEPRIVTTRGELSALDALVRDRLVFIGWTATGSIADFVTTPLGARTPGVVVHAQIASGELTGMHKRRWPNASGALLLTSALGLLGMSMGLLPPRRAALLGAALLGGYTLANTSLLFDFLGLLAPLLAPLTAGGSGLIATATARAAAAHRERAAIRRQFRARIDPKLAERLERDPKAIKLDGELRDVTVAFTDLSGYTALAEQRAPDEVVALLNTLQSTVTSVLIEHGAYINKFLGDGIMAIWGAPEESSNHAALACQAVLRASQAVDEQVQQMHNVALTLRAGIASGNAIVGDCGAPPRLNDYTAIGDVVNVAARLEDIGAAISVPLLTTRATAEATAQAEHAWRPRCLGPMQLPGRVQPVHVFQLCAARGAADEHLRRAVQCFANGSFAQCAQAWSAVAEAEPALHVLAARFAQRCDVLAQDPSQTHALIVNRT